jgi:NAD-dependent dihydropyrimidine dehydrogenase PreA subunit
MGLASVRPLHSTMAPESAENDICGHGRLLGLPVHGMRVRLSRRVLPSRRRHDYIDPENCIDCGGCAPIGLVGAIKPDYRLAADEKHWIAVNRQRASKTPVISARQPPLPGADARREALGR